MMERASLLTPRQVRIASMLAEGFLIPEIALELGIRYPTVKTHLHEIYERLGLNDPSLDLDPRVKLAVFWNCELFQVGLQK